jgi:choline dehydrogenase-like flavoprotein
VGGGLLANEFIRLPIEYVNAGVAPSVPKWGKEHKNFMRQWFKRSIVVWGPVQEMPVFDARVQVDPVVKDYWGIPVVRLSGKRHGNDLEVAKFISAKAAEWLKEAGAIETWRALPGTGLSGGQHQAGTCRMGNDPKTSVVNAACQVHDVDNLFVVDASVHPNNGGFNPVLTIMANAYRVSDGMKRMWKGTRFKG